MSAQLTICLGKTGDILTLLPLLQSEATSGPVPLMVSKAYSSVLEGVSYVNPIVFDGDAHEVSRAATEASKLTSSYRFAQVCGPPSEVRKHILDRHPDIKDGVMRGDSFEKSLWDLCGSWGAFGKGLPLVFDRRSPEREKALIDSLIPKEKSITKKKVCLVSTGRQLGQKPPENGFRWKDLVMLVLDAGLKPRHRWQIIDLDNVTAERFYDLLGLYERASLIVATDNAPLHLAYGCPKLPVCALIQDKPTMWCGSAWRPNHIFHCRYSDFPDRAVEMMQCVWGLGMAGDPFWERRAGGNKIVHVWSQYEVDDANRHRHEAAVASWKEAYHRDQCWVNCKIDRGAFGRDSESMKFEGGRYPLLKDVLRAAGHRAKSVDDIVVTRADTCVNRVQHGYAHRILRSPEGDTHSPWIDMVCFPKTSLERLGELPDLVMGPDPYWAEVLAKWAGVEEIENAVWRVEK